MFESSNVITCDVLKSLNLSCNITNKETFLMTIWYKIFHNWIILGLLIQWLILLYCIKYINMNFITVLPLVEYVSYMLGFDNK